MSGPRARPILVTGGGGRLARQLEARGMDEVTALSRGRLDITDPAAVTAVLAEFAPALVINAAVVSSVEAASADEERAFAVNAAAPGLVAKACADRGIPLMHISTDYVFGADTGRPWREDDPVSPVNSYGEMKAEGERRVLACAGRCCIARVAWLFGDGLDFLTSMLDRGRRDGVVTVAHDQVGSPTPIGPLASVLLQLAERMLDAAEPPPSILHLAGSPPVSRADWVQAAFEGLAQPPRLVRAPMASFGSSIIRPRYSALDTSRSTALVGDALDWRPWARSVGAAYNVGAPPPF